MTDREWRRAVENRHLRERLEVAEATNVVLMGALMLAGERINEGERS